MLSPCHRMVKYPYSTWPKPLGDNIRFLAVFITKIAAINFASVDQFFLKLLTHFPIWSSWQTCKAAFPFERWGDSAQMVNVTCSKMLVSSAPEPRPPIPLPCTPGIAFPLPFTAPPSPSLPSASLTAHVSPGSNRQLHPHHRLLLLPQLFLRASQHLLFYWSYWRYEPGPFSPGHQFSPLLPILTRKSPPLTYRKQRPSERRSLMLSPQHCFSSPANLPPVSDKSPRLLTSLPHVPLLFPQIHTINILPFTAFLSPPWWLLLPVPQVSLVLQTISFSPACVLPWASALSSYCSSRTNFYKEKTMLEVTSESFGELVKNTDS